MAHLTVTMTRPGRYDVTDDDIKVGEVKGDYAVGFDAYPIIKGALSPRPISTHFGTPESARDAAWLEHFWSEQAFSTSPFFPIAPKEAS